MFFLSVNPDECKSSINLKLKLLLYVLLFAFMCLSLPTWTLLTLEHYFRNLQSDLYIDKSDVLEPQITEALCQGLEATPSC